MPDLPKCYDCGRRFGCEVCILRTAFGNALTGSSNGFEGRRVHLCLKCRRKRAGAYQLAKNRPYG